MEERDAMKRYALVVLMVVGLVALSVVPAGAAPHPPSLGWAVQLGGELWSGGTDVAVDGSGNVYVAGGFTGTADFDPGPGVFELTSVDETDIFVTKLNSTGGLVWAGTIGGGGRQANARMTVDGLGNVYVAGEFAGTVDFDPGPGVFNLTSAGDLDGFVVKLDGNGGLMWAGRMGGSDTDRTNDVTVDGSGNVYVTGEFRRAADVDPGAGVFTLTSAGWADAFVAKLDHNGDLVWGGRMGGGNWDRGYGIALDSVGNVYTTGYFRTTADFDPGPGVYAMRVAGGFSADVFVSKLTNDGAFVWARAVGGTSTEVSREIAIGGDGDVYVTGYFRFTADFDPGPGVFDLTSAGDRDVFVIRLDGGGDLVWAGAMGGTALDFGFGIAVDGAGNVYTSGYFIGTADFDPGPGVFNLTSAGAEDPFVSKLDSSGAFVWAGRIGSARGEAGRGVVVDTSGSMYATGWFAGTVDFDPGPGVLELTNVGNADAYLWKLSPSTPLCGELESTIVGTEVAETLVGTSGPDVIHGLSGHDLIKGRGGDDVICGGDGDDTLIGGRGHDTLRGGFGDDDLSGGLGNDRLFGGPGGDVIAGGPGRDLLRGTAGDDQLNGGGGADEMYGEAGGDLLQGGPATDMLRGGSGDDTIFGNGGPDTMWGGPGFDSLSGGGGTDTCHSGETLRSCEG